MNKIFFTSGPCQLYPTVKKHILEAIKKDIPSISHRGEKFHEIFQNTQNLLKKLLKIPERHKIFFLSSGTEAMERVIENTVDKFSLHFVNGAFSDRFYQTAVELGKRPFKIEAKPGNGFNLQAINISTKTEVVCLTQNETSTGVSLPLESIYKLKRENPAKLIALDTVSSAPYADVDYKYIDLCFFSVQKGFGLPAGLGVLIVSPQALEKYKYLKHKNAPVGSYHSFDSLLKYEEKSETPETPNVLAIYLLGKVTSDILKVGTKIFRTQTEQKAKWLYDFFDKSKRFKPFVKDKLFRSNTVVVVEAQNSSHFTQKLKQRGLIVGRGYGEFKNNHLRIANFPAHRKADIKLLLRFLDSF